jgi:hypothetical protein
MNQIGTPVLVREIMLEYAGLTGLEPPGAHPRRYLWTDAFAVCNYLGLFRRTNDEHYRDLALRLVDQVHHTLGRHRDDDARSGWISGLSEQEGEMHPTAGGLRIGKPLKERTVSEPFNERLEWDRDGQYYHYLTKWMHTLNQVARVTGDPTYIRWAIELAKKAHAAFTYLPPSGGKKRMYWKMCIDLSRPLVPSMGLHDPLDGLVTYSELQVTTTEYFGESLRLDLEPEIADLADICLFDAERIVQLMVKGGLGYGRLLETVVDAALLGLVSFAQSDTLAFPAGYRLAFRELGLAIGLKGVEVLLEEVEGNPDVFGHKSPLQRRAEALRGYLPLGEAIDRFWMDDSNREAATWIEHREINMVTLATSLAPEGFLKI